MASPLTDRVCNLLVKKKVISQEDLKKARKVYTETGGDLTEILVRMNAVSREDILSAFSEIGNFTPINLSHINVDKDALKLIPKRIAMMYQVLPISRMGAVLTVAMVDPLNIFAVDDLKAITRLDISPLLADAEDMKEALRRCYERSADEEISEIVEDIDSAKMEMIEDEEDEISSGELLKISEETPVIKLTNLIISQAVKERASDILIEPMEKNFRVRYRIDGVLHVRHNPPKRYHRAIISRIKVMSNLNIAETRLPQDGRFMLKIEARRIDFRVSVIPSIGGEKASLRILDKEQVMIDISKLGLKERDEKTICTCSDIPHGMILV